MDIGLVLGGGGARGFAHIGVLKSLEKRGSKPVAIAGCSMGGIVGALIAAGFDSGRILDIVDQDQTLETAGSGQMGSLIGGRGMAHQMEKYLPDTFEELEIPLAVTAVDLQEGKLVVISDGPLHPALRGTSSIPGIISTEEYKGRYLIDGGLLNNLPVDVIRSMTNAPVLAVDVASPPNRHIPVEDSLVDRAKEVIAGKKRPLNFEMFMKAFDIPASMLTDSRLALNPPEILVRPRLDPDLKTEDLNRFAEAADAGFIATEAALDRNMEELESQE